MLAATSYKLLKYYKDYGGFTSNEIKQLAIGNVVAFIVAIIAIRSFIAFLSRHGFKAFGWYRIVVGGVIIVLYLMNVPLQMM